MLIMISAFIMIAIIALFVTIYIGTDAVKTLPLITIVIGGIWVLMTSGLR